VRGVADALDTIEWTKQTRCTHTLDCTEFTSLCPVTGQPDFGRIEIVYSPVAHIVETKSLKLWLRKWRERGAFNEVIVEEVADEFFAAVKPAWVRVTGRFNHRGGIAVSAVTMRGESC
jgi:7-cyano-7-deazaguanine reductase